MPTFEITMYQFSHALGHLKFHFDHTYCKWVDVDSIVSNVTMEYVLVRKIYSFDLVHAKSLNEFLVKS